VKLGISNHDQYNNQFQIVVTFEPLAQTWTVEMWRWKTKYVENENNCIAASRRTRAGVNPEPGTDQFRYQYDSVFKNRKIWHEYC
jgi:hypothetical protein